MSSVNLKAFKLITLCISMSLFACTTITKPPKENLVTIPDRYPVFPGCEPSLTNPQLIRCFSQKVSKFVRRKFNTNLAAKHDLMGKLKIYLSFKINTEGRVIQAKANAPHPALAQETIRIIQLLPQMFSGTQKGKKVTVPFVLPISFLIQ